MKHLAIILAGFAAIPAHAGPDTDYPHRDWGKVATLDMTVDEATACIARQMARRYATILPVPMGGGTDIDAGPGSGLFGVAQEPWMRYKIRQDGENTILRVFYRHPASATWIDRDVKNFQKQCLKVRQIDPS